MSIYWKEDAWRQYMDPTSSLSIAGDGHVLPDTLAGGQDNWPAAELDLSPLRRVGYAHLRRFFSSPTLELLHHLGGAVAALPSALPPTMAVIFDIVWEVQAAIGRFLEAKLDRRLAPCADLYIFRESSGWGLHRDRSRADTLDADGSPRYVTAWIPLEAATVENGCMQVVPAPFDDLYQASTEDAEAEGRPLIDYDALLPLPAAVGDVLLWTGRLLHTGGRPNPARFPPGTRAPRAALSMAFADITFESSTARGLLPPDSLLRQSPSLSDRLELGVLQLLLYKHNAEIPEEDEEFTRLVAECRKKWGV